VGGYPRFQQDGFSFMLVDPWPQDWPEDWYATDDVPGIGIALTVVL